jgi:PTS system nitrogen regulatory IIA component
MVKAIRDLIQPESVFLDLSGGDKFDIIHQIIQKMGGLKLIQDPVQFEKEVIQREKEIPTGLQMGTALPHARSKVVDEIVMAFARLKKAVDFGAGDSEPARLIFLFGVPSDQINDYLKLAAKLCRLLRQKGFRDKLLQAEDEQEVIEVLQKV